MTRTLWIAALICALACYVGVAVICILALVEHRHLGLTGWYIFVSSALLIWIALGYVRFRWSEAAREREERRANLSQAGSSLNYLPDVGGAGAATAPHDLSSGGEPVGR